MVFTGSEELHFSDLFHYKCKLDFLRKKKIKKVSTADERMIRGRNICLFICLFFIVDKVQLKYSVLHEK